MRGKQTECFKEVDRLWLKVYAVINFDYDAITDVFFLLIGGASIPADWATIRGSVFELYFDITKWENETTAQAELMVKTRDGTHNAGSIDLW